MRYQYPYFFVTKTDGFFGDWENNNDRFIIQYEIS